MDRRPILAMSHFLEGGRSANQLFRYMFLTIYAHTHGLELRVPPWDGRVLFGRNDPPPPANLPLVLERRSREGQQFPPERIHKDADVYGWFQYHTSYYRPHRELIRALFEPVPAVTALLAPELERRRAGAGTLVGFHVRRTDFGFRYFYRTPLAWYRAWLDEHWSTLPAPRLFIASDEPEIVREFADYAPLAPLPGSDLPAWYPDFYFLSQCDVLLMPNSSYSFAAALFGNPAMRTYRSNPEHRRFEPIDVWNSEPLRRDHSYAHFSDQTELWTDRAPLEHRIAQDPSTQWGNYVERSLESEW